MRLHLEMEPSSVENGRRSGQACHLRSRRRSLVLVAPLLLLALARPARADGLDNEGTTKQYPACTEEPSEKDIDAAKGAFQAGRISFEEADYDRAILYWEDAFRRDCTAVKLLLNVARAYELRGDLTLAVVALRTYLARDPEVSDRDIVETRIEKLEERVAEKEKSRQQELDRKAPPPPPVPEPAAQPEPAPGPARPIWPIFVTAGGVVTLGVGATFAILGHSSVTAEKDRIESEVVQLDQNGDPVLDPDGNPYRCTRNGRKWDCPSESLKDDVTAALDDSEDLRRAKTQRTVGILVASGGAVVAGVGAYFWYTLWSKPNESTATMRVPAIVPHITLGYQGVSLVGQF